MGAENFIEVVDKDIASGVQKVVGKVLNSVIKKTPVNTGWCKRNWNLAVGEMDTTLSWDKRNHQSVLKQITGEKDVFITNHVFYAIYLEAGHSVIQAPRGIVAPTISELKAGI